MYDTVFEQVDVLVMPTTPMTAHRYEPDLDTYSRIEQGWNMLGNTGQFNLTGHPALSVPCGMSDGLPVGLMLTGRQFDDATLLRVGHAFEQQMAWEDR